MNPARILLFLVTAACSACLIGCAWSEQEPDEVADNLVKGMSGQGTVTNNSPSELSAWERRN
ncbi:MAG: hypothetical protein EBR40_10110 [Proteobacteria bacterium]|nr:hypothetical protein [Pseudomonadota bacterium]